MALLVPADGSLSLDKTLALAWSTCSDTSHHRHFNYHGLSTAPRG
jgi:hypothetical protein